MQQPSLDDLKSKIKGAVREGADTFEKTARDAKKTARREMREMKDDAEEFIWSPFLGMQREMMRMMDQNLKTFSSFAHMWQTPLAIDKVLPRVRVWEDEKEFHLQTRLPGDNPDHMEVTMHDGFMTLKWDDEEDSPLDALKNGMGAGIFHALHSSQRTVMIPENADASKAHAVCKNGMLEVIVPKKKLAASQGRSIPIEHPH